MNNATLMIVTTLFLGCTAYSDTTSTPSIGDPIMTFKDISWEYHYCYKSDILYSDNVGCLRIPTGFYKFTDPLTSDTELTEIDVGNDDRIPDFISIVNNTIYAYFNASDELSDGLYRSTDNGDSWSDISDKFNVIINSSETTCPPFYVIERSGLTYCNIGPDAGINLFYYDSDTDSWTSLYGNHDIVEDGGGAAWDLCNGVALAGMEGNVLDMVQLSRGVVSDDGISWATEPYCLASTSTGTLTSGTNYMVIKGNPLTGTFLIGEEGGILRATDEATKLEYAVSYWTGDLQLMGTTVTAPIGVADDDPNVYPYTRTILYPTINSNYALAGGYDAKMGYLAWSQDDGATWTNLSELLDGYNNADGGEVTIISEDPSGRIIIGARDKKDDPATLTLVELKLPNPVNDFDADATHVGSGWQYSPTLGYAWGSFYPWLWSYGEKAWIYATGDIASDAWLYDEDLAWLWTSADFYPWLWDCANERWIYFVEADDSGRTFYDAKAEAQFTE